MGPGQLLINASRGEVKDDFGLALLDGVQEARVISHVQRNSANAGRECGNAFLPLAGKHAGRNVRAAFGQAMCQVLTNEAGRASDKHPAIYPVHFS